MQSLLDPSKGFKAAGLQGEAFTVSIGRIFAFAYVWALGGNLAPAARPGFDEHVREQLQDVVSIPGGLRRHPVACMPQLVVRPPVAVVCISWGPSMLPRLSSHARPCQCRGLGVWLLRQT